MVMAFDDTMTEVHFQHPILHPSEERMLAAVREESDLDVPGLRSSLISRLISLFDERES